MMPTDFYSGIFNIISKTESFKQKQICAKSQFLLEIQISVEEGNTELKLEFSNLASFFLPPDGQVI